MRRALAALVALVLVLDVARADPPGADLPRKSAEVQLSDGRLAYDRGDYAIAVGLLTPLLYPSIVLGSEAQVIDAHRLLVLSYFFTKREAEAEAEAIAILTLRSDYRLDAMVDPAPAVTFFDDVRKKQDARLREARSRAERVYIERTVEHHSRLVATIPFGVGQFQNGQPRKAALFLSGEVVFAALSLSGYLALEQKYPVDSATNKRYFPADEKGTAQALIGLQLGAGIAFWATLLWGVIDAHVLFKREVVKTRELPTNALKSLTLAPTLSPTQAGLAVQGAF